MRQFMMTVMALTAFGAMLVTAQAENQTPSSPTVSGPAKKRTVPQSVRDAAKPPPEWDLAHPGRAGDHVSAALQSASTCTGLKSVCMGYPDGLYAARSAQNWVPNASYAREYFETYRFGLQRARPYLEKYCNFLWERCMKSGFWEGYFIHRSAERR